MKKNGQKRLRRVAVTIALLVMMSTMPVFAVEAIENGFSPDLQAVFDEYCEKFNWDKEKYFAKEWVVSVLHGSINEELTCKRLAAYQKDFFEDNITTTRAYLGLSVDTYQQVSSASIVAVALSEIGKSDSIEKPVGSNNVKYNTWYHGRKVSGDRYGWNGTFVSWCADQSGLISSGTYQKNSTAASIYRNMIRNGCQAYNMSDVVPMGGTSYEPVAGDLAFFSGGGLSSSLETVGIIVQVKANGFYCVEGDSNDKVSKNWYGKGDMESSSRLKNGSLVHVTYN